MPESEYKRLTKPLLKPRRRNLLKITNQDFEGQYSGLEGRRLNVSIRVPLWKKVRGNKVSNGLKIKAYLLKDSIHKTKLHVTYPNHLGVVFWSLLGFVGLSSLPIYFISSDDQSENLIQLKLWFPVIAVVLILFGLLTSFYQLNKQIRFFESKFVIGFPTTPNKV